MGFFGLIQSLGMWATSMKGSYTSLAAVAATTAGVFGWNYLGGDPSQLKGLGAERFQWMNDEQDEKLRNNPNAPFWDRYFRRSSRQAIIAALSGGIGWVSWALASGYRGPREKAVKHSGMGIMVLMSALCAWSASRQCRTWAMQLPKGASGSGANGIPSHDKPTPKRDMPTTVDLSNATLAFA